MQNIHSRKNYTNGEVFLFLGKEYSLKTGNYKTITLKENEILFPHFLLFRIEKELLLWYTHQAQEVITKRVVFYAKQMNSSYASISFSDTKSRWGSCSADNKLQFNWRLIMAPLAVLDYVVVHELAHTMEKNHTWKFWSKVRFVLPAYKHRRHWLKLHGDKLVV